MMRTLSKSCFSIFAWFVLLQLIVVCCAQEENLPRIGIIGAGIGGTSSAYFLRQLFGDKVQIDVYEANKVGGRAALVELSGYQYEAGAVAIFKKNRYMYNFNKLFTKDGSYRVLNPKTFGIYGPDGFVFRGGNSNAETFVKLISRYGSDLFTIRSWIEEVIVPQFLRIYTLQDDGLAFTSCEKLLGAMSEDFVDMTKITIEQVLKDIGVSQRFIEELALGIMKDNFGQSNNVHGFVGSVSLIGTTAEVWSVIGGNKQIPEFVLKESKASSISGAVTKVTLVEGNANTTYKVDYVKQDANGETMTGSNDYDIVILAAPINGTRDKVDFINFPSPVADFSQDYHRTLTIFVKDGKINKSTYNLKDEREFPPVVYVSKEDLFYDHLVLQPSVDRLNNTYTNLDKSSVWEIYLSHIPTEEELSELFESRGETVSTDWLAYPEYRPKIELPTFVLNERLYYLNAIESAASALEMSAIGAKNVALLAYNQWYDIQDRIDKRSE